MNLKKLAIQALVGAMLFTVITVVLDGSYTQEVWQEKGYRGLIFGLIYGVYLMVKEKFIKKK